MNIFSTRSGIVGEASIARLNRSLTEFFEQTSEIRARLDRKVYLLDKYISFLFEAVALIAGHAY